ncbi:hypothetical protein GOV13_05395 [Candidatus Pacearchaeota archaeon]|nr:hypothetical protein [Candidatus Pacearchaeota archaeon]
MNDKEKPGYAGVYTVTASYDGGDKKFQIADRNLSGLLQTLAEEQCLGGINPSNLTLEISKDENTYPLLTISKKLER